MNPATKQAVEGATVILSTFLPLARALTKAIGTFAPRAVFVSAEEALAGRTIMGELSWTTKSVRAAAESL